MRVVSNTSPISNLAMIGRLNLLRERFGRIIMPEAVHRELGRLAHVGGQHQIAQALDDGWLSVEALSDRRMLPVLRARIDEGEAEAIELARQTNADLLILDDHAGRVVAKELSLAFTGLIGVLVAERMGGKISSLRDELHRLRSECGFFISNDLENRVLRQVGES